MKAAVDKRDWNKAADEMKDSKWYNQVIKKYNISISSSLFSVRTQIKGAGGENEKH